MRVFRFITSLWSRNRSVIAGSGERLLTSSRMAISFRSIIRSPSPSPASGRLP